MTRLLSMLGTLFLAGTLCSCIPDGEAKRKQQAEWDTKAALNEAEIIQLKSKSDNAGLPVDWENQLLAIKHERAAIEADIKSRETELLELKQQREAYAQRLEEFRITHPLN